MWGTGLVPLTVCILATTLLQAQSALLAVDLGSEFIKVCLVKPGRTPIAVVVNEMSKRKSPALVGFVSGARLLGEEAYSFAVRYPETTFQRARDLLGKDANDTTLKQMLVDNALPYKIVQGPTGAAVQVDDNTTVSAEELVASLLYYAKGIAEASAGGPVVDAVITVPAFFGQRQRQALIDAAGLAGLKVLGLLNSHTAAALQYGIERDFSEKPQNVILYDLGSSSTVVSLVRYSTYSAKDGSKPKATVNQLEVKDVEWDADLGSSTLDTLLAKHFAKEFSAKAKVDVDVTTVPKAMSKLKRNVRRTKEMLSANSAAPCSVEELYEGKDFQASITRESFEVLAADYFERAAAPLARILARNNLTAADLDAVELLGGGTRVPRVQAALSEVLGGRVLDRHLDADEAAVLGAGLFAANLSTVFRLRKFGMVDMSMYGVSLTIDHVVLSEVEEGFQKVRNLVPYMKKLPSKRVVKLENVTADPLRLSLAYNTSTHHGLPPGVVQAELASYNFTGIEAAISKYNTSGVVTLKFEADYSGMLRLDKAEAVIEYTVMEEKIVEVKEDAKDAAKNSTAGEEKAGDGGKDAKDGEADGEKKADSEGEDVPEGEEASDASEKDTDADDASEAADKEGSNEAPDSKKEPQASSDSAAGETAKDKDAKDKDVPASTIKRIQVPKTKIAKVALKVESTWAFPMLAEDARVASEKRCAGWIAAEAAKKAIAKARNDLESYILATRELLDSSEDVLKVTTEAQRSSLSSMLTEDEDWLYMEADESLGAQQFVDKLTLLKGMADPMKKRAEELTQRPDIVAKVRSDLSLKRSTAKAWVDTKPWVTDKDKEPVFKALDALEADVDAKEAAQAAKALHEPPAFTSDEVLLAWDKLDKLFSRVSNKKKPPPPPEPKPAPKEQSSSTDDDEKPGDPSQDGPGSDKDVADEKDKQQEAKKGDKKAGKKEDKKDAKKDAKKEEKKEEKKDAKKDTKKEEKKDAKKDSKKDTKKEEKKDSKKEDKKDSKKDTKKEEKKDSKKDSKSKKDSRSKSKVGEEL